MVVPDRPPGAPSGGDRYDAALALALRRRGVDVRVTRVAGSWPWPTEEERRALGTALATDGEPVLVDGLVGSSAPEEVAAHSRLAPVVVLVHSRLSAGAGAAGEEAAELDRREARSLSAAAAVVTISSFAARELSETYGLRRVVVAPPGTEPAPVAPGSAETGAPCLLTLGALTPSKNHVLLLDALATVRQERWTAVCAGPAPDTVHLASLHGLARRHAIADRVSWPGAVVGPDLERLWAAADLLVHPSRSETYGLVVAEAHAHGIPTVVGRETGAVEALDGGPVAAARDAPGGAVATDRPDELAAVLRRWLSDPSLRARWRDAALARRERLSGWEVPAAVVEKTLAGLRVGTAG